MIIDCSNPDEARLCLTNAWAFVTAVGRIGQPARRRHRITFRVRERQYVETALPRECLTAESPHEGGQIATARQSTELRRISPKH